jgi:hypothetical protein
MPTTESAQIRPLPRSTIVLHSVSPILFPSSASGSPNIGCVGDNGVGETGRKSTLRFPTSREQTPRSSDGGLFDGRPSLWRRGGNPWN